VAGEAGVEVTPRPVHVIAWVGGSPGYFIEAEVTKYFHLVVAKYPDATHVTGSASGGEAQIRLLCEATGKKVTVPPIYQELPDGKLLQVCNIVQEADAVVIMGTKTGGRAKLALEILKRVDGCREEWNKRHLFTIATPPKEAAVKKKAVPKKKREAAQHG
jgi:hypothetical protein